LEDDAPRVQVVDDAHKGTVPESASFLMHRVSPEHRGDVRCGTVHLVISSFNKLRIGMRCLAHCLSAMY
jgi:hypothetical protein